MSALVAVDSFRRDAYQITNMHPTVTVGRHLDIQVERAICQTLTAPDGDPFPSLGPANHNGGCVGGAFLQPGQRGQHGIGAHGWRRGGRRANGGSMRRVICPQEPADEDTDGKQSNSANQFISFHSAIVPQVARRRIGQKVGIYGRR